MVSSSFISAGITALYVNNALVVRIGASTRVESNQGIKSTVLVLSYSGVVYVSGLFYLSVLENTDTVRIYDDIRGPDLREIESISRIISSLRFKIRK